MIRLFIRMSVMALISTGLVQLQAAKPLTAFQALQIAAKAATAEARNQVIAIEGPRSATELCPDVWKFVFWDPSAKQNGRLITVTRGQVTEIRDGFFELDKMRMLSYKQTEVILPKELKIDSDKALDVAVKSSTLQGVRLSSVTFSLRKDDDVGQAVEDSGHALLVELGTGSELGKDFSLGHGSFLHRLKHESPSIFRH